MTYITDNIRLKELHTIAEQNKAMFDAFEHFLRRQGYHSVYDFIQESDSQKALHVLIQYITTPLPEGVTLYDGAARPYSQDKAKWLFLGWLLRDAPEQRLKPMVAEANGNTLAHRRANLLNNVRIYVSQFLTSPARWEWVAISEVIMDRLEGSRRAIKGTLFEAIVRRNLKQLVHEYALDIMVYDNEMRIEGETYDVVIAGSKHQILIPVKTRETMGGGHALLFTRDIHKSIQVAYQNGYDCLPVIIAESWSGNLEELDCDDFININMNPNQVVDVEPVLRQALAQRVERLRAL
mgnify:CR=1 FL=1